MRIVRKGPYYFLEYKDGFFSFWNCVSKLGIPPRNDSLEQAKRKAKAFKSKKLIEVVWEN